MARLPGDTAPLLARLWREWLSPHRGVLAVVMGLIAVVGASTGLYPALIKAAFDAFDRKDASAIAYGPLVVILVTSLRGFALYGQTVLTNKVVTRVEADMQAALYGHLIESDLAQLGRESPAALTQRFTTDFAFIKEALTRISTVLLRDIAMLIGLVGALLWMDPILTLVAGLRCPSWRVRSARSARSCARSRPRHRSRWARRRASSPKAYRAPGLPRPLRWRAISRSAPPPPSTRCGA